MPSVYLLIKPSSGNCNLRCAYCFYCDEMEKREVKSYGFMSTGTLEALVRRAFEAPGESCGFAFQGGEPTLSGLPFYERLIELEKKYNTRRVPVFHSIQTNGLGLGEDWADFFAKNRFLVGISLDGIKPTHDAFRRGRNGEESFGRVMDTIRLFEKRGVEFNILTVVNARTAGRVSRIYDFYQKQGWSYFQFIPCLDPLGEKPGGREYSLTPEAYGEFLERLFDRWYIDVKKGQAPYIREFENYIGILMGYEPEQCSQKGYCSVQLVVEADGSVYPCDFYVTDGYRMGNIEEDPIEALRRRGMELGFVEGSLKAREECGQCPYGFLCRGGCRRMRAADGQGGNYFCASYRRFFEKALPRLRELAALARRGRGEGADFRG